MKLTYCSKCIESYIECLKMDKLQNEMECWKKFQECLKICVTADKKDFASMKNGYVKMVLCQYFFVQKLFFGTRYETLFHKF